MGRIRRPHGVRGELVVDVMTDEPGAIFAPGRRVFQGTHDGELSVDPRTRAPRELVVSSLRPIKDGWLMRFDGINDRTEAEKWNGRYLLVPVEELSEPEEGEVFAHELVGMQLVDAGSSATIGEVIEFYDLPQGLLLEFRTSAGAVASLPFVDEFVDALDREARTIRVRLPNGLLDA
ncbi:MAG: 16S rRNA processing protein RimM [Gemmatimonadaceae bacterium]|nr:16S rRNA processing protein RimM [Gemmatimonadaceae bacterium]MCW5825678.1 16S rRNA processing protein RimM [Gemmatimonadaceae bacterium]